MGRDLAMTQNTIHKGSIVKLAVDPTNYSRMIVLDKVVMCDGTGGDGAGLLCTWFEGYIQVRGWLSESSVVEAGIPGFVVDVSQPLQPMRHYDD